MQSFKKSLLLLPIGLLSLNIAHADIACPASVTCDGKTCWTDSAYWTFQKRDNVPSGKNFSFTGAKAYQGFTNKGQCFYGDSSNPLEFHSYENLTASTNPPDSKWQTTNNPFSCDGDGITYMNCLFTNGK